MAAVLYDIFSRYEKGCGKELYQTLGKNVFLVLFPGSSGIINKNNNGNQHTGYAYLYLFHLNSLLWFS